MKKQIFILALFILTLFVNIKSVYGQALNPGITATQPLPALSCEANANFLHPIAGKPYTYQMNGTSGNEDVSQWTWFATKNTAFITAGALAADSLKDGVTGELLAASANYGKPDASDNVQITWTPQILANTKYQGAAGEPTFVVGYGTGANCSDNIKVYEINPIINFTVDITNIDGSGNGMAWDKDTSTCVANVQSATYTSGELVMDYGTDTLYFEVAAANFVTDFTPTFNLISGLTGVQTAVVSLHSSYANAKAGTLVVPGATTNWTSSSTDWQTGIHFTAANPNDIVDGVSLFVKVVITNSTEESLTANPFVLAVDAQDDTETGIWDMEDADCTTLADAADQVDRARHIVKPRPTITGANVPDSNTAEPNNIVPKNP